MSDAARPTSRDLNEPRPADASLGEVCEHAIAEVVRLILELTSSNQALDYVAGARVRSELEQALREAQHTFEALPEGAVRARALQRLDGLRIAADRQLKIAPPGDSSASPHGHRERTRPSGCDLDPPDE